MKIEKDKKILKIIDETGESVFMEFEQEIDEENLDWYIEDLKQQLDYRKQYRQSLDSIPRIEPTYDQLRRNEYPEVQQQLDMLYWDMINGTNNWQDLITQIKTKYPKPSLK